MFLGLLNDPDPLVRGMELDPAPDTALAPGLDRLLPFSHNVPAGKL